MHLDSLSTQGLLVDNAVHGNSPTSGLFYFGAHHRSYSLLVIAGAPFAVAPHSFFYCSPISLIPSQLQKCLCPSPSLSGSSCQATKIVINSSQKGQQLCGVCDICALVTRNQVKFKSTNLVSQLIFKVTRRVLDSQNHCISGQTLVVEILYIISVIDEALLCEIAV